MRYGFVLSLLLAFTVSTYSQNVLSLDEALRIALQQNTDLKTKMNDVLSAKSSLRTDYGNLLPSLSMDGSWQYTRNEDAGGVYDIGNGILINQPASTTHSRTYSTGLSAYVTLFDGLSNYKNIEIGERNVESSILQLERAKQDIVFYAMSYYYDILNQKELIKVRQEDLKWNRKNLEIITERNNLGAVTIADVYEQQVNVGNAELSLLSAENNLEQLKADFLYYLGLDVLDEYRFEDRSLELDTYGDESFSITIPDDLSELTKAAMENRSDYKAMKLSLVNAEEEIDIAFSGHLPSLTNRTSYSFRAPEIGDIFDTRTFTNVLSLNIPIFSGWSVSNQVQQAEIRYKNLKTNMRDFELAIKKDVQKTYLDLQRAEKSVEVSRKNVQAAMQKRKIAEEKYNLGATTLLDVLNANAVYLQAQTDYINARFSFLNLRDQLEYYLGILDYSNYEN